MMDGLISNRIRVLRFLNGEMSQAELGQRIGVTRQTIAAIEGGKYSPTLESAFRIAHVFGVPLEEVFKWELIETARPGDAANSPTDAVPTDAD
jgi:putative transcriptional regulator